VFGWPLCTEVSCELRWIWDRTGRLGSISLPTSFEVRRNELPAKASCTVSGVRNPEAGRPLAALKGRVTNPPDDTWTSVTMDDVRQTVVIAELGAKVLTV